MALTKISRNLLDTGVSDSSDATAITITSGENIGIGTDTPSQKLHIYNSTLQVGSKTGDTSIQQNTNAIRISAVPNTTTEWGGLQWYREFSDYIGAEIIAARAGTAESDTDLILKTSTSDANATERMRITHGGLVGIGVTSPDRMLHVKGTATSTVAKFANTGNVVYIELNAADQAGGDAGYIAYNNTKDLSLWTDDTERMRIDSSGNALFGTTSSSIGTGVGIKLRADSSTAPYMGIVLDTNSAAHGNYMHYNLNSTYNGYRFYVFNNGGIANYQANNSNLSDERVKTNIELSGNYLQKICDIPVKLFNYKDEPENKERSLGVIAQDVEAAAPELVNNEGFGDTPEDGVPLKTVYTTDMMYALMKAIQELSAKVEELESKINE